MTDFSEHLIAARKALKAAEDAAQMHDWREAVIHSWEAEIQIEAMRCRLHGLQGPHEDCDFCDPPSAK